MQGKIAMISSKMIFKKLKTTDVSLSKISEELNYGEYRRFRKNKNGHGDK